MEWHRKSFIRSSAELELRIDEQHARFSIIFFVSKKVNKFAGVRTSAWYHDKR